MRQKGGIFFRVLLLMLFLLLIPGSALAESENSAIDKAGTSIQSTQEDESGGDSNELVETVTPEVTEEPETPPLAEEDEAVTDDEPAVDEPEIEIGAMRIASGGWAKNSDGSWRYQYSNKSYPVNWAQINGEWYYFAEKGRAETGFLKLNGVYYYLLETGGAGEYGRMLTGWQTINEKGFYFNDSGGMQTGWQKLSGKWYYFKKSGKPGAIGRMLTGWQTLGGQVYYLKKTGSAGVKGRMLTGWQKLGSQNYYFNASGRMLSGWQQLSGSWYYFKTSGAAGTKGRMQIGWQTIGSQNYYFSKTGAAGTKGRMRTGWQTIGSHNYYFNASGRMLTGWQKLSGKWYYFKTSGAAGTKGRMLTGWQTLGGRNYYLKKSGNAGTKGRMLTGWQTLGSKRFYFKKTSVEGSMLTGWQKLSGNWYYFKKTGAAGAKGRMLTGWQTLGGKRYYLYSDGKMAKSTTIDGIILGADGAAISKNTIKGLLQTALEPVGSTLYIWGGGHDDWSGGDALRVGANPNWKSFYNSQSSSYNYSNHRYEYKKGLDCSGYVGWVVYNNFNTKSNQTSCTTTSTITPKWYSQKGWGSYSFTTSTTFLPGDVVSKSGHVWIVLGQCSDGSVVIAHSTPQAGVQLAGTVDKKGGQSSEAIKLAKAYMKKYYPACVKKFSLSSTTDITYLKGTGQDGVNRFRWTISSSSKMNDPEGIRNKTAAQVLKIIFNE